MLELADPSTRARLGAGQAGMVSGPFPAKQEQAAVVKPVDTQRLGRCEETLESSNLSCGTKWKYSFWEHLQAGHCLAWGAIAISVHRAIQKTKD